MLDFALDALAGYRLTKLVVDDELTREPREALIKSAYTAAGRNEAELAKWDGDTETPGMWEEIVANDPDPPKLATLTTCPWCASFWVGAAVVILRRVAPRQWTPIATALSFSALTGLISEATA